MPHGIKKPITIDGVRYPSLHAAAKATGYSYQAVQAASAGKFVLGGRGRMKPCKLNGKKYPSISACALATGIPFSTLMNYRRAYDGDDLVLIPPKGKKISVVYEGKVYESQAALARHLGFSRQYVNQLYMAGKMS